MDVALIVFSSLFDVVNIFLFPVLPTPSFSTCIPKYCIWICCLEWSWFARTMSPCIFYTCAMTLNRCPVVPRITRCSSARPPCSASAADVVPPISVEVTPQRREALCISASKSFHCGIPTKSGLFQAKAGHQWINTLGSLFCLAPKILEVLFVWMNCTHVLSFLSSQV